MSAGDTSPRAWHFMLPPGSTRLSPNVWTYLEADGTEWKLRVTGLITLLVVTLSGIV